MKHAADIGQSNDDTYQLRPITKVVGFLALLTGLLYLRVVIAEGLAGLRAGHIPLVVVLLFVFLLVAAIGLVISWRWEGVGGLLALLGGLGLAIIDYNAFDRDGWLAALLYSSPFVISGTLCLACWWRQREAHSARLPN